MSSSTQRLTLITMMLVAAPTASGMYAFAAPPPSRGLPFYYYTPILEAPPSPVDLWHDAFARISSAAHHPAYAFWHNPIHGNNLVAAQSDRAAELATIFRNLLSGSELNDRPASTLTPILGWTDDGDGERVSTTVALNQPVSLDEVSAQVALDEGLVVIRSEQTRPYGVSSSSTQLKLPFAVSSPEAVALELAEDGKSVTISVRKAFKVKPLEPSDLSITAAASTASIATPSPSPATAADLGDDAESAKAEAEGASSHVAQEQAAEEAELDHKFSFVAESNQDEKKAAPAATAPDAKHAPAADAPGVGFEFEKADEPVDAK